MNGLLSFLCGSAFRLIWSQIAEYLNKQQEHAQEIERLRLQAGLDKARHNQDCERIRLQSDLGVKEIMVKSEVDLDKIAAEGFFSAAKEAMKPIGVAWVDAWNSSIRPATATIALGLWIESMYFASFVLTDWDRQLMGVALGFFFASRELSQGRK